jgi:Tfp pilus assembly protein PilF
MKRITGWAALGVLILSGSSMAETVYLKSGGSLDGKVLELSEDALVMTLDGLEGSKVEVPLSRVSDYSLYVIKRARIDKSSAADHEKLGDWATGRGLLAFAMDEYGAVVKIAGDAASEELENKLAASSSRCGADKLSRGKKLIAEGDLAGARSFFRDILKNHPTCPAADAARDQVKIIDARIRKERKEAKDKRTAEKSVVTVLNGLKTAKDLLEKGDRLRNLGFRESGSLGRAENDFLAAIDAYLRAKALLAEVRKLPAARSKESEFSKMKDTLDRRLLAVYVDVGHNYIVKGNLIKANHYMGLALAIDPNDPKALALRQAIAVATASDNWGRPG